MISNCISMYLLYLYSYFLPLMHLPIVLGHSQNPYLHNPEVKIPNEFDVLTLDEKRCFSQEMVYWPQDGACHTLLEQGPCRNGEWLVVSETFSSRFVNLSNLYFFVVMPRTEHFLS